MGKTCKVFFMYSPVKSFMLSWTHSVYLLYFVIPHIWRVTELWAQ